MESREAKLETSVQFNRIQSGAWHDVSTLLFYTLTKSSWWNVICLPGGMTHINANFADWGTKE